MGTASSQPVQSQALPATPQSSLLHDPRASLQSLLKHPFTGSNATAPRASKKRDREQIDESESPVTDAPSEIDGPSVHSANGQRLDQTTRKNAKKRRLSPREDATQSDKLDVAIDAAEPRDRAALESSTQIQEVDAGTDASKSRAEVPANSAGADCLPSKQKRKRIRHTGRPSGVKLAPMVDPEQIEHASPQKQKEQAKRQPDLISTKSTPNTGSRKRTRPEGDVVDDRIERPVQGVPQRSTVPPNELDSGNTPKAATGGQLDSTRKQTPTTPDPRNGTTARPRKNQYDGDDKGPFKKWEQAIADEVFEDFCSRQDITAAQLKQQILDWKSCEEFKAAMQDALPRRSQATIRKFSQRRYSVLARGPWTPELDEELRKAYVEHPGKWTVIGNNVGRLAPDCKDRWTNFLQYQNRETGPWTVDEERALAAIVVKLTKKVEKENKNDNDFRKDRSRAEAMVNWHQVAEELGGKRSARTCRLKWHKIKDVKITVNTPFRTNIEAPDDEFPRSLKRAQPRYAKVKVGDKYAMLKEIVKSVKPSDQNRHFRNSSTFWSVVSLENRDSVYDSTLRRLNYYECLEQSERINNAKDTIVITAQALAKELRKKYGKAAVKTEKADPAELQKRRYEPKRDLEVLSERGDGGNGGNRAVAPRKRSSRRTAISSEFVADSGDEGSEDAGADGRWREFLSDLAGSAASAHRGDMERSSSPMGVA